ncbi:MAG: hypothetical protein PHR28_14080, partial [candidate division Zixibacteria bacterium]|nr:hypothetical protein [candidate division Zixibacteria bacterium]
MAEVIPHYPHLSFERPSYEEDFREGMRTLGAESRTVFLKLLDECVGESSPYIGKVVLGVPPFAVRLFWSDF